MNEIISTVLSDILLGALSLLAAQIILWANKAKAKADAETLKIEDERQQGLLRAALDQMGVLVEKTVCALEQTVAKDLRQAVKNGTAKRSDLIALGTDAVETVWDGMKSEYIDVLKATMKDADKYLKDTIETEVLKVKMATEAIKGTSNNQ